MILNGTNVKIEVDTTAFDEQLVAVKDAILSSALVPEDLFNQPIMDPARLGPRWCWDDPAKYTPAPSRYTCEGATWQDSLTIEDLQKVRDSFMYSPYYDEVSDTSAVDYNKIQLGRSPMRYSGSSDQTDPFWAAYKQPYHGTPRECIEMTENTSELTMYINLVQELLDPKRSTEMATAENVQSMRYVIALAYDRWADIACNDSDRIIAAWGPGWTTKSSREIEHDMDLTESLASYNLWRTQQPDRRVLHETGNTVMMEPLKFDAVCIIVKEL